MNASITVERKGKQQVATLFTFVKMINASGIHMLGCPLINITGKKCHI